MNLLTVESITKSYTERMLFDGASFYLQEGEKAGVIGKNGTGKSTLLKMIAGLEVPDTGSIIKANHVIIRYLSQNPVFMDSETVLESVLRDNRTRENEWTLESDAKAMLQEVGITDLKALCGTLSGGQRKRLALVSVLLSPADILVLDEPTNHLDHEIADWLEDTLKKWKGALVMVTHDRYFLDSVSNRIIEIDKGQIYSYQTNYSGFLTRKAEREEMAEASERKRQSILRTELEWVRRGPRARSTRQKARLDRYEELKSQAAPEGDGAVGIGSVSSRLGRTTVELVKISKRYGDRILINDFSYIFLKNDRIGFIGPNGCGKTTLMKILSGQIRPDSGSMEIGRTVKIGYYSQEIGGLTAQKTPTFTPPEGYADTDYASSERTDIMDPNQRVIDYVRAVAEYVETEEGSISASQMLERFLFAGSEQYNTLGRLSGGERRRLNLLRVLMGAPNVLILDEPTNDLDITTLAILEDYLDRFQGIVIVVSHDRYFLDRVVRRIFAFEDGGRLRQYEGGYTDYADKKQQDGEESGKEGGSGSAVRTDGGSREGWKNQTGKRLKFTFQEQKDYENIEMEIAALEEKTDRLEAAILESARDFVKLNELTAEKERAEEALEERMSRWMYLEELAERIARGETVQN